MVLGMVIGFILGVFEGFGLCVMLKDYKQREEEVERIKTLMKNIKIYC